MLAQHRRLWHAATGVRVGIATMARTFTRLGITRNKSPHGARTRDELDAAIGGALPHLTATNATAWMAACSYHQP